jgi:hypothetical protein
MRQTYPTRSPEGTKLHDGECIGRQYRQHLPRRLSFPFGSQEPSMLPPARQRRAPLLTAPRSVIGYHGCSREAADRILSEQRFLPSTRAYDWLGEGVYFWEYAPYRALDWAILKCAPEGSQPAVLRATIKLGRCLNLLDIEHLPGLRRMYEAFVERLGEERLPRNTERGAHFLDRALIDAYCRAIAERTDSPLQTVRGSFAEGEPIYPGSKILTKAHAQIAVRDTACILRASLVEFP